MSSPFAVQIERTHFSDRAEASNETVNVFWRTEARAVFGNGIYTHRELSYHDDSWEADKVVSLDFYHEAASWKVDVMRRSRIDGSRALDNASN